MTQRDESDFAKDEEILRSVPSAEERVRLIAALHRICRRGLRVQEDRLVAIAKSGVLSERHVAELAGIKRTTLQSWGKRS